MKLQCCFVLLTHIETCVAEVDEVDEVGSKIIRKKMLQYSTSVERSKIEEHQCKNVFCFVFANVRFLLC